MAKRIIIAVALIIFSASVAQAKIDCPSKSVCEYNVTYIKYTYCRNNGKRCAVAGERTPTGAGPAVQHPSLKKMKDGQKFIILPSGKIKVVKR